MAIYGRPDYSLGKDYPTMGPWKNFNPKLVGPGGSKVKVAIYAGYQIGKFLWSRPWVKGSLTGIAIGTGLGIVGTFQTDVGTINNNQALRQYRKRSGNFRKRSTNRTRSGCYPKCCH